MPLLHHSVLRPLRRDRAAVEHPRLADREVGDVDHLLDFAVALRLDLAVLERDERAECVLVLAQERPERAHGVAALRRGNVAPPARGRDRRGDDCVDIRRIGLAHAGKRLSGGRILRDEHGAAAPPFTGPEARARAFCGDAEAREHLGGIA